MRTQTHDTQDRGPSWHIDEAAEARLQLRGHASGVRRTAARCLTQLLTCLKPGGLRSSRAGSNVTTSQSSLVCLCRILCHLLHTRGATSFLHSHALVSCTQVVVQAVRSLDVWDRFTAPTSTITA
jgi:hypothetical protein